MQKAHSNINWENLPSKNTPLGAYLLNKQDREIDVIDDRVLALYGYQDRVAQSEKNAKTSETNAKTSETNAKQSELLAKEYADRAFIATPENYEEIVDKVEKMDIQETTSTTLLDSKEGGYKLLSMSGNSVQNETPTPDAPQSIHNVGDCVEIIQGVYSASTGAYITSANYICSKNRIPCNSGDVVTIRTENAIDQALLIYYNGSTFVSFKDITYSQDEYSFTIPSGVTHFNISVRNSNGLTVDTVGKISLTIDGKYVVQIKLYDDNGNERVATVLLNEPLREDDVMSRTEVMRKRGIVVFNGSENWSVAGTNASGKYRIGLTFYNAKEHPAIYESANMLCDNYSTIPASSVGTFGCNVGISLGGQTLYIYDENFNTNDVSLWKAHLQSNPITVEYELAEEVIEELDTTSQIALNSLETFDGVTYINVDSRVQPKEIKGEYGTSKVGARTIKNELRNDTLEIKYNELAVALVATESGV